MQKILGLDIGISSIGWALIEQNEEQTAGKILKTGCRIVPTDAELLLNFEQGVPASKAANRRDARSMRRQLQRYKNRRARLVQTLMTLGWLPKDYKIGDSFIISPESQAEMKALFSGKRFRPDWIIYYLRDKATREKIELYELARIIYHFNQRRGFKSSRKSPDATIVNSEDAEKPSNRTTVIEVVTVTTVKDTGEKRLKNTIYEVTLSDGRRGTIAKYIKPEWEGKEIELQIKEIKTKKDTRVEFADVEKTDWLKQKEALAKEIDSENKRVSKFYLNKLIQNPNYIIRDRHIDRKRYRDELEAIWQKQSEFHPELSSGIYINQIADQLYKHNAERNRVLKQKNLYYILTEDIIYYQRPLRSQKNLIADCRLEKPTKFIVDGKEVTKGIKVAPVSSPIAQEFRIWQIINNLRVIRKELQTDDGKYYTDINETDKLLTLEKKAEIFDLFDSRENVSVTSILTKLGVKDETHRLNYADESLPGNSTKAQLRKVFKKHNNEEKGEAILNNSELTEKLWHILYSIEEEEYIFSALTNKNWGFDENLALHFSKIPAFKQDYVALSTKAMRKMLSLMRAGKYFNPENIPQSAKDRINHIIDGEVDESITDKIRTKFSSIKSVFDAQSIDMPIARYLVYGQAELDGYDKLETWEQIEILPHNTLRNPLVEQITNETLRLVRDIWKIHDRPDQIRIEIGRDLKKNAKERKEIWNRIQSNEAENKRVRIILQELMINPTSHKDIERLKLWEETGNEEAWKTKIKFSSTPTKSEIEKYKLWGEQNHLCPYTGETIPLSKLFSGEYDVDHIIPRSRYFDDSMSNKTVCRRAVNKEKDNRTALEYIQDGSIDPEINTLKQEEYIKRVKANFKGKKRAYLLMEEPPEDFVNRQLNDTKYITRKLMELLKPIAGSEGDPIVPTGGRVTSELKAKWGLTEKMKQLVRNRFERLEKITGEKWVEEVKTEDGKVILQLRDYEKRIDHRHHTLDAIIVACTSRSHTMYFNTLNAQSKDDAVKNKYRNKLWGEKRMKLPWPSFHEDVNQALATTVISFKGNKNILQKGKNKYQKYVQENGAWKKASVSQTDTNLWTLKYPLHKETMVGKTNRTEYKLVSIKEALNNPGVIADKKHKNAIKKLLRDNNGDIKKSEKAYKENPLRDKNNEPIFKLCFRQQIEYAAPRASLDESFTKEKIEDRIFDKSLKQTLLNHLSKYNNDSKSAFGKEGLFALNSERENPIKTIRLTEDIGSKFIIRGNYTEAAKGTNLFFLIYENKQTGERLINKDSTLSMFKILPLLKEGLPIVESKPDYKWITLSPNDLVYMPDENEDVNQINWDLITAEINSKIYKMISCTRGECLFIPHFVSKVIADNVEFQAKNKIEKHIDGRSIKKYCVKLITDRLGEIQPAKWND
jgi:CRISPR-associated endonuclease Csn1